MNWLTNTPFLTKERGFLLQVKKSKGFYADPYKHCWASCNMIAEVAR